MGPLLISRSEYKAVQAFRGQGCPDQKLYDTNVQSAVLKLLKMMVKSKLEGQSQG